MHDTAERTPFGGQVNHLRLGDRVVFRVAAAHDRCGMTGDIIGVPEGHPKILVGWADGTQSWELPIELRRERT